MMPPRTFSGKSTTNQATSPFNYESTSTGDTPSRPISSTQCPAPIARKFPASPQALVDGFFLSQLHQRYVENFWAYLLRRQKSFCRYRKEKIP